MRKLVLAFLLCGVFVSTRAQVFVSGSHCGSGWRVGWSFPACGYACYPGYSCCAGPSCFYYPAYPDAYTRPNYVVGGTLLGALTGGLIGSGVHHQGWEGAGIGAAAGFVLGSIAELGAKANERAYAPPPVYSAAPAQSVSRPIAASSVPSETAAVAAIPAGPMRGANALFGR